MHSIHTLKRITANSSSVGFLTDFTVTLPRRASRTTGLTRNLDSADTNTNATSAKATRHLERNWQSQNTETLPIVTAQSNDPTVRVASRTTGLTGFGRVGQSAG